MSQSALVVGLLALAFILYVAARGRLTAYTGVLWGPQTKADQADTASGSGSGGGLDISAIIAKAAPTVIEAVAAG